MAIQHHPHTRIGRCGFAERQARLFEDSDILEVQQTFYQPPQADARRFMQLLRGPTP